jgi:hypothetical protein
MSEGEENRWPNYLWQIPTDDIFAVGVITLNYSRLENTFQELFQRVTGTTAANFYKKNNPERKKTVLEVLEKRDIPEILKQPIKDFLEEFIKCARNRNAVDHAFTQGTHQSESTGQIGILLFKSKEQQVCAANADQLRAIADDMHNWSSYGGDLNSRLRVNGEARRAGHKIELPGLPAKPAAPTELNWGPAPDEIAYLFDPSAHEPPRL